MTETNWFKKARQFSQTAVIYSMGIILYAITGNFILAWFGKETLSDMVITVIGAFATFVTGGYFLLCGVRDCSKNKYGIKENNDETVD